MVHYSLVVFDAYFTVSGASFPSQCETHLRLAPGGVVHGQSSRLEANGRTVAVLVEMQEITIHRNTRRSRPT